MKFTVIDLKKLTMVTLLSHSHDDSSISDFLHEAQPDLSEIIDEVGLDPRCRDAHRFCTLFCAATLMYVDINWSERMPAFPGSLIHDARGLIARKEELQIGKRACTYPDRIRRHVLYRLDFDEDDASWLCTTISAFLVIIEETLAKLGKQKSS